MNYGQIYCLVFMYCGLIKNLQVSHFIIFSMKIEPTKMYISKCCYSFSVMLDLYRTYCKRENFLMGVIFSISFALQKVSPTRKKKSMT